MGLVKQQMTTNQKMIRDIKLVPQPKDIRQQ